MKKRRRKRKNFNEKKSLPVNDDAKQLRKTWETKRKKIVKDIFEEKKRNEKPKLLGDLEVNDLQMKRINPVVNK